MARNSSGPYILTNPALRLSSGALLYFGTCLLIHAFLPIFFLKIAVFLNIYQLMSLDSYLTLVIITVFLFDIIFCIFFQSATIASPELGTSQYRLSGLAIKLKENKCIFFLLLSGSFIFLPVVIFLLEIAIINDRNYIENFLEYTNCFVFKSSMWGLLKIALITTAPVSILVYLISFFTFFTAKSFDNILFLLQYHVWKIDR